MENPLIRSNKCLFSTEFAFKVTYLKNKYEKITRITNSKILIDLFFGTDWLYLTWYFFLKNFVEHKYLSFFLVFINIFTIFNLMFKKNKICMENTQIRLKHGKLKHQLVALFLFSNVLEVWISVKQHLSNLELWFSKFDKENFQHPLQNAKFIVEFAN